MYGIDAYNTTMRLSNDDKESNKEGKKNIGKDSKILMQINKKDHNLSIYKTARSSYLLINEAPKRYTIISLEGDIRPCSLSNIFTK